MNKKCSRCKENRELNVFHKNKKQKDGLSNICKLCRTITTKIYYRKHKKERLTYAENAYKNNPNKFLNRNKKWRDNNPEKRVEGNRIGHKKWYSKKENKKKKSEYYINHKDEKRKYDKEYRFNREKIDLNYKIANRLRTRLNMALRKKFKNGSAVKDLGCSIEEFVMYIENLWIIGMNWSNYGNKKDQWSLDHIIPLSSFDLTNRDQFLKACHYSNIQPMWHLENMKKHNKNKND